MSNPSFPACPQSKRLQTLEILLASIKEMWVSLEIDAKTALERELSEFDVMETFVLSAENMESVKELNMEVDEDFLSIINNYSPKWR